MGEIFLPVHFKHSYLSDGAVSPGEILNRFSAPAGKDVFGFTLLYNELFTSPYITTTAFVDEVTQRQFKMIHLVRDNLLRRYVSNKVAHTTALWGAFHGPKPTTLTVTVNCMSLYLDMRRVWRRARRTRALFCALPRLELTYEDLCVNFSQSLMRICEFLEISYENLEPRTFKQENRPLREAITNYDRLKLLFGVSPYRRFFDD